MKSEHRHELQTNDLGKVADKLVPVWHTYSNQITIAVCVVMVAAAAVIYWVRRSRDMEAAAWNDLVSARNAEDFADVAERRVGSSAAQWARLQEGEARLTSTIQLMFTDREAGVSESKKARDAFEKLVKQSGNLPEVRERALYGLARILETTSNGDESEAIKTYETLLHDFPNTVYKQFAEKSIATLKSGGAQDFYAWFSKQNPKPPVRPKGPADRGLQEDLDGDFPMKHPKLEENSEVPTLKDDAESKSEKSEPEAKGEAPAKKDAEDSDGEKPDAEKPDPDKPESEAPKSEKPADEKPEAAPDSKESAADEDKPKTDSESSEKP